MCDKDDVIDIDNIQIENVIDTYEINIDGITITTTTSLTTDTTPVTQNPVMDTRNEVANFNRSLNNVQNSDLPFKAERNNDGSGSITVYLPDRQQHAEFMDQDTPPILVTSVPNDPELKEKAMRHFDKLRITQEKNEAMSGVPQSTISRKLNDM